MTVETFAAGNYRYIKAVFQYSGGVAAEPGYEIERVRFAKPLPLNDAAILLGLPDRVALIVYWHAEIAGYALLKQLVAPMMRRVLERADRIIVSLRRLPKMFITACLPRRSRRWSPPRCPCPAGRPPCRR